MTNMIMLLVAAVFSMGMTAQEKEMQKKTMHNTKMMQNERSD